MIDSRVADGTGFDQVALVEAKPKERAGRARVLREFGVSCCTIFLGEIAIELAEQGIASFSDPIR